MIPEIGDIKKGKEFGYKNNNTFIWQACEGCGKRRWVLLVKGKPRTTRCKNCFMTAEVRERNSMANRRQTPKWDCNTTGLAGEFRVMSELLLRGHNPAKSYLNNGADFVLENNLRIEVKAGHKTQAKRDKTYRFHFRGRRNSTYQRLGDCDFVICWGIEDDCFYIIPASEIKVGAIAISDTSNTAKHKFAQYKDKWEFLNTGV